jgi:hypothetical protein
MSYSVFLLFKVEAGFRSPELKFECVRFSESLNHLYYTGLKPSPSDHL